MMNVMNSGNNNMQVADRRSRMVDVNGKKYSSVIYDAPGIKLTQQT